MKIPIARMVDIIRGFFKMGCSHVWFEERKDYRPKPGVEFYREEGNRMVEEDTIMLKTLTCGKCWEARKILYVFGFGSDMMINREIVMDPFWVVVKGVRMRFVGDEIFKALKYAKPCINNQLRI